MKRALSAVLALILLLLALPASAAVPSYVSKFGSGKQLIVVTAKKGKTSATLSFYGKNKKGKWEKAFSCAGVVGRKGLIDAYDKLEGDGHTPTGTYPLTRTFGQGKAPEGAKMPWQGVDKYDYWVDDQTSDDYNTWVRTKKEPSKLWKSFERLKISLYRMAVVVEYNTNPVVKGKGSAIFLHLWKSKSSSTAGCIAISETSMKRALLWLNPDKSPHIMIRFA